MAAHLPDVIDEDILCCPLCLRQTRHPKVLPCLHLFCHVCLEDYVERWEKGLPGTRPEHKEHTTGTHPKHPERPTGTHPEHEHTTVKDQYFTFSDTREAQLNLNQGARPQNEDHTKVKDEYLTFLDTKDRHPLNRRSGASDTSDASRKRFQQPERYTDRDALVYHGALYREKYRQSQTGRKSTKPDTNHTREMSASPTRKTFTRAMSSPQRMFKSGSVDSGSGSDMSLAGRVTNIINLYEQKSTDSLQRTQHKEQTPPLASFRTKSKDETTDSNQMPFVPLSQRPLPEPNKGSNVPRSYSVDSSPITRDISLFPRTISLSTQESWDSAIGTGESDKQLVFVDSSSKQSRISSISEEENYYERVEMLGKPDIYDNTSVSEGTSRYRNAQSDIYELAKSTGTMPKSQNNVTESSSSSILRKKLLVKQHHTEQHHDQRESLIENFYDEIQSRRNTLMSKSNIHGSVPDLLADTNIETESRISRRQRRNSTNLDSYVTASDVSERKDSDLSSDLSQRIPLSSEDSQRLSNMYMRMDGTSKPFFSQTSYISMDGMLSPGICSPNVFPPESVATIIRSISEEFKRGPVAVSIPMEEEEMVVNDPPVYANTEEHEEVMELDMPIPIYDAPKYNNKAETVNYYNNDLSKEPQKENKDVCVPCPKCRRPFLLPDHQVAALQDCSFASQMQEVVQTQKCERKQCGHCEHKVAAYKCLDCELYLCKGCQQGHSWSRSNKGHKVMTLQELQSGKFQTQIKQLQVTRCESPGCVGGAARHVCAQCERLLCSDCLVRHPAHHQSRPVEEIARREQDFIQSMAKSLQSRKEVFHGALNNLSNYQQHCRDSRDVVLDHIKSHQDFLYLILDRSFDFLRSKVMKEHEVELSKTDGLKTAASSDLSSMDHILKFAKQIMEHGNPGNVVAMATIVKQEISRLQAVSPRVMESQITMSYKPVDVSLQQVQPLCGDVFTDSTPLPGWENNLPGNQAAKLTKHHTHQMELLVQFTTKLDIDTKGCRPNGVAISPIADVIVVVDDINKKLKAFDFDGNFQWEISPNGQHMLKDPWDVTFLSDGRLAVTDKGSNDIKVFSQAGEFLKNFGDHLKKPWGITTNSKGEILVTDSELRKVFIQDSQGFLRYTIPNQMTTSNIQNSLTENFTLKCPEYICCNMYDDIIISDFENHRILAFDSLGRPLFKFGKKGKGMEEFHYPLGVATDSAGNIYVINYQNQRVTVVNRNGHFVCCLTSKVTLQSLQTLCVNRQGHLVVIDGSWVKIFKLPQIITRNEAVGPRDSGRRGGFVRLRSETKSEDREAGKETTV